MINVVHLLCKTYLCSIRVSEKYEGYCLNCFINIFPDKPVTKNYKTKEKSVIDYILEKFSTMTWRLDKKIEDGCNKKRPDMLLDLGHKVIIVEVDENQHITYDCSCEDKRALEISEDLGFRQIIFLRFNPDDYINKDKRKITSCWDINTKGICAVKKSKKKEWLERLETLRNQINYWINEENKTDKLFDTIHLFYDEI